METTWTEDDDAYAAALTYHLCGDREYVPPVVVLEAIRLATRFERLRRQVALSESDGSLLSPMTEEPQRSRPVVKLEATTRPEVEIDED
jgi:hypothetical protein